MSHRDHLPPQLAERLLRACLPAGVADQCIRGDLREEYQARVRHRSRFLSALWFWYQSVRLCGRFLFERIGLRLPSKNRLRFTHAVKRVEIMGNLWQDVYVGMRALAKRPGYSGVVLLTLTLGIGATTAIFSVVNGALLRPLPHSEPARLVAVHEVDARRQPIDQRNRVSPANFRDWRDQNRVFRHVAAYGIGDVTLTEGDQPDRILSGAGTAAFFDVLRAETMLGRTFLPGEDVRGNNNVVVLSYGLWQRVFGGDSGVIGQTIRLAGATPTIVGVMRRKFDFLARNVELWYPRALTPRDYQNRRSHFLRVIARLADGVTVEQAQRHMETLASGIGDEHPEWMTGWTVNVVPLEDEVVGEIRPALLVLLAAVAVVLLIACVNVANLTLARNATRQREIAVRAALGAGRARLIRASLTESLLLALMGGGLGAVLAAFGTRGLLVVAPPGLPRLDEVGMDGRVLAFAAVVSLATGVLFGLVPAVQAARVDLHEALKDGGRAASGGAGPVRLRSTLVVTEVALSVVLLVGAGLLIGTFTRLMRVDSGFDAENVLAFTANLPRARYPTLVEQNAFYEQALDEMARVPGVSSAGMTRFLPLAGSDWTYDFLVEGQPIVDPGQRLDVGLQPVSADYFAAMGMTIVAGRGFTEHDDVDAASVIIINETMARRFFPNEDPVGKYGRVFEPNNPLRQIVGVVADTKHDGLDAETTPTMYPPQAQMRNIRMGPQMTFAMRTASDPITVIPTVRRVMRELDREVPLSDVRTMAQVVAQSVTARRFSMILLSLFAAAALGLAVIGIYGVISYSVGQRTQEIGVRVALGARPAAIQRLVVGGGMTLALLGIGVGVATAVGLSRFLSGMLFEISATDPLTYGGVSLLLALVAALACYLPARRAGRVDPTEALRDE